MAGYWRTKFFGLRYGAAFGALFPPVSDTTPPTITNAGSFSVNENAQLAVALTADEAVTWSIAGAADAARFEISGSTLRWLGNGTKNFEAPDDSDANNIYSVNVRATDGAGNFSDKGIIVTVLDVVESGADPNISAPTLSLAVGGGVYPPQLNTPLPADWQAGVTSIRLQASTVADSDAGWITPSIDNAHLITDGEAAAHAWSVSGISSIVTPTVTAFRARAEQGAAFSEWSNVLIHGDVTAPSLTSSTAPAAISELVDSVVYTATFNEKVTITSFGGADGALLEADAPTVPATSFTIRRLDHALLNYATKTSYGFTITAKDRANNSVTTATITAAVKDEVPTGFVNVFTDVTGAAASTLYTAPETYTVAGLTAGVSQPLTISGGEYRLNTGSGWGAWTTAAASVQNGDQIQVRGTSSSVVGGVVSVVVTIAGTAETFNIARPFDPATLFGPSDDGYFFDISDLSTLFSDTARTTAAVVDGPVKGITDKSGKGHHMTWVSGNTLTLRQSGSFYYLEASATNGVTSCSVAMAQPWYRISAVRFLAWVSFGRVFPASDNTTDGLRQHGSSPLIKLNDGSDGPTVSATLNTDMTLSEVHNNTGSSLQIDNATAQTGTSGATAGNGQVIMCRSTGANPVNGWFYGDFAINRNPTSGEKASLKTFFSAKYGGSL